jgi:glyceraldehyde-3-phosphate dehydrogenase/erythrose-4-phosphate dehydrogenase
VDQVAASAAVRRQAEGGLARILHLRRTLTMVSDAAGRGSVVKTFGWYDNETGFSHRTLDLVTLIGRHHHYFSIIVFPITSTSRPEV